MTRELTVGDRYRNERHEIFEIIAVDLAWVCIRSTETDARKWVPKAFFGPIECFDHEYDNVHREVKSTYPDCDGPFCDPNT